MKEKNIKKDFIFMEANSIIIEDVLWFSADDLCTTLEIKTNQMLPVIEMSDLLIIRRYVKMGNGNRLCETVFIRETALDALIAVSYNKKQFADIHYQSNIIPFNKPTY
ncbi:hypothetical protein [Neobacillus niacini]|uniref:hypothetical protein n=1 Tax=Neobacillus niacini TaxID=86668 RepID=UPI002859174F|nr:hypothetical protein [Neobacillus niacini]MDR7002673.1 prophage antirepressor-like protein [Neobacillus niacini]